MATEAEAVRLYQLEQNRFAENYPALLREKAESEAYAKTAEAVEAAAGRHPVAAPQRPQAAEEVMTRLMAKQPQV